MYYFLSLVELNILFIVYLNEFYLFAILKNHFCGFLLIGYYSQTLQLAKNHHKMTKFINN